jgi:hypothetical protein
MRGDCVWLECDSEVFVCRVERDIFDYGLPYVVGKISFDVLYTAIHIFGSALSEHLNAAIGQISDKAAKLMAVCNPVSGETKAHTLDVPGENYVLCNYF